MHPATVWMIRPWIDDFSAFDHFAQPLGFLKLARQLIDAGIRVHYVDCLKPDPSDSHALQPMDPPARILNPFHSIHIEKPTIFSGIPRHYRRFGAPLDDVRRRLAALDTPDAILITTGMTYWYRSVRELVDLLTDLCGTTPIALGGIYATIAPDHARRTFPSASVFPGPLSEVFHDWLAEITGHSMDGLPDDPVPAWELAGPTGYAALNTSSGCMQRCEYCVASAMTPAWSPRPIDRIREEIDQLVTRYTFRHIALYDDDLGCGTPKGLTHFRAVLQMLCDRFDAIHWHTPNALGVATVTSEIAALMKTAGFEQPRLSLHHLDRHLGPKGLDDSALRAFATAAEHLIRAGYEAAALSCYIIAGLPGQRLSDLEQACSQLVSIGIRPFLAQYSPIPGTPTGETRLRELGYRPDGDILLTNKILSVYRHSGWTGDTYQAFATDLKNRRSQDAGSKLVIT